MSAQPASLVTAPTRSRIGFLGLGWIGRKRLDSIGGSAQMAVAALADNDAERLESAAQAYPQALAATSLEAMLECGLDGIVIATPNGCHVDQAIACLQRGIAVFCQKPLATNARDAARVIAAAQRADRLVAVDYCYRHVQGMLALRERIARGELGEITAIDLTFHNAYGPDKRWCQERRLAGGGCLLDLGVHLLDLAGWLVQAHDMQLVSSALFANGRPVRGRGAALEDAAFAQFRHISGALVRLACSWHAHMGCDAVIGAEIFGSRGGAAWRNVGGSFYDFTVDVFHSTSSQRIGSYPDDWGPRALNDWIARLQRDRSFDVAAASAVRQASLIDEIYAS